MVKHIKLMINSSLIFVRCLNDEIIVLHSDFLWLVVNNIIDYFYNSLKGSDHLDEIRLVLKAVNFSTLLCKLFSLKNCSAYYNNNRTESTKLKIKKFSNYKIT